jgi:hypothetical protein
MTIWTIPGYSVVHPIHCHCGNGGKGKTYGESETGVRMHGPRYKHAGQDARATHFCLHLRPATPNLSLRALFGTVEGGKGMIALEETKACFKPREEPFDPG